MHWRLKCRDPRCEIGTGAHFGRMRTLADGLFDSGIFLRLVGGVVFGHSIERRTDQFCDKFDKCEVLSKYCWWRNRPGMAMECWGWRNVGNDRDEITRTITKATMPYLCYWDTSVPLRRYDILIECARHAQCNGGEVRRKAVVQREWHVLMLLVISSFTS